MSHNGQDHFHLFEIHVLVGKCVRRALTGVTVRDKKSFPWLNPIVLSRPTC